MDVFYILACLTLLNSHFNVVLSLAPIYLCYTIALLPNIIKSQDSEKINILIVQRNSAQDPN